MSSKSFEHKNNSFAKLIIFYICIHMHLDKFIHSNEGKYLMSILLGLGLATLFRTICKGKRCKVVKAPPMEEIEGQIYKFDEKCYEIKMYPITCDSKRKTLK